MPKVSRRKRMSKKKGHNKCRIRRNTDEQQNDPNEVCADTTFNTTSDEKTGSDVEVSESSCTSGAKLFAPSFFPTIRLSSSSVSREAAVEPVMEEETTLKVTKKQQLLAVKQKVELFLPHRWSAIVGQDMIHIIYVSPISNIAIQRSLNFTPDGNVKLFVHCHPVCVNPYISNVQPPLPLKECTVNYFVDRIVSVGNNVRQMEVCSGYDENRYQAAWSSCTLGEVDINPYKECRYIETFRSVGCERFVNPREWRCLECSKLCGALN